VYSFVVSAKHSRLLPKSVNFTKNRIITFATSATPVSNGKITRIGGKGRCDFMPVDPIDFSPKFTNFAANIYF
jgi:hypothetical protein